MIRVLAVIVLMLSITTQAEACRVRRYDPTLMESIPDNVPTTFSVLDIEVLEVGLYGTSGDLSTIVRARVHEVVRGEFIGREINVVFPHHSCTSAPSVGARGIVAGGFGEVYGHTAMIPRPRSYFLGLADNE
jgi:hypothetical protein